MIQLPTKPVIKEKSSTFLPELMMLVGARKIGKTTDFVSSIPECLIIDTEYGTKFIDKPIMSVDISSYPNFIGLVKALKEAKEKEQKKPYKVIVIDSATEFVDQIENYVAKSNGEATAADVPYNKGREQVQATFKKCLNILRQYANTIILVCHIKVNKNDSGDLVNTDVQLYSKSLVSIVSGVCDSTGKIYRNKEGELMISFESDGDLIGSRIPNLKQKTLPAKWQEFNRNRKQK